MKNRKKTPKMLLLFVPCGIVAKHNPSETQENNLRWVRAIKQECHKKRERRVLSKLMRLGSPDRIVVDSDSKVVDFDRRITWLRILTIKIESTILIFDINRSKI